MGWSVYSKTNILVKEQLLRELTEKKGWTLVELNNQAGEKYGYKFDYRSFMSLVRNDNAWKILYAWAVSDVLGVSMYELFEVVKISENELLLKKITNDITNTITFKEREIKLLDEKIEVANTTDKVKLQKEKQTLTNLTEKLKEQKEIVQHKKYTDELLGEIAEFVNDVKRKNVLKRQQNRPRQVV